MILNSIKDDVKEAMRQKNSIELNALRGALAGFTNELIAKGKKPQEEISDDEAIIVLKRMVKQRRDSFEQFKNGGRNDLAEVEGKEIEILKKYLPTEADEYEIKKVALAKKEKMSFPDKSKAGILVGAVMAELKGRADGQIVKKIVDSLFE